MFSEARRYRWFDDHPLSDDRIELLRQRAEEQPHYKAVDSPDMVTDHEIMKAKLIGFTEPPQTAFFKYPDSDHSFVARYARAIAYYRETETDHAMTAIDELLHDYPNNPYLWELKGQVLFEAARTVEAEAAHQRSVELKPDAPLLRVNLAQAMIAQNNLAKMDPAILNLRQAISLDRDDLDIFWGAYLGGPDEILVSGRLGSVGDEIRRVRAEARARHGWIMDTYLLRPRRT